MDGMNGTWKTIAVLALGGVIGGGAGTISSAWADQEAVRNMIAASPEIATVRANQSAIKEELARIRLDQKESEAVIRENARKLDLVLFRLERERE